jgi:SAM-dependent methyltransferase
MYTKKPIPLPKEYKKIYKKVYKDNRDGTGLANFLSQKMETWGHKIIEKNNKFKKNIRTLEIGAGNLNHLKFVKKIHKYDIIEPNNFFYKHSNEKKKINKIYKDISDINLKQKYDRIISVMVLEHILNLPKLLKSAKKILKKGGIFQASIPCQGELAFYLGWRFTTGLSFFLKYGLNWGKIMEYEHVNTLDEIFREIKKNFKNVVIKRSPLPFLIKTKHASFYAYIEGSN